MVAPFTPEVSEMVAPFTPEDSEMVEPGCCFCSPGSSIGWNSTHVLHGDGETDDRRPDGKSQQGKSCKEGPIICICIDLNGTVSKGLTGHICMTPPDPTAMGAIID